MLSSDWLRLARFSEKKDRLPPLLARHDSARLAQRHFNQPHHGHDVFALGGMLKACGVNQILTLCPARWVRSPGRGARGPAVTEAFRWSLPRPELVPAPRRRAEPSHQVDSNWRSLRDSPPSSRRFVKSSTGLEWQFGWRPSPPASPNSLSCESGWQCAAR